MEPASTRRPGAPAGRRSEHFFAAGGYQLRQIFEDDGIYAYKFHVDLGEPAQSTFMGPEKITVSPYHFLCDGQLTQCVPQPGLDHAARLAGRQAHAPRRIPERDGVESIVMLHSIATEVGAGGERWYEMRLDANRDPYLYQQSTYAPDDHYRWMGSPDIDRKGDIALAYSYGGGPYILPIATTLAAAQAAGATNIKVAAVTGTNMNFAPAERSTSGPAHARDRDRRFGRDGRRRRDRDRPHGAAHDRPRERHDGLERGVRLHRPACVPVGQRYTARQPGDPLGR